jgi:hypothetical protein
MPGTVTHDSGSYLLALAALGRATQIGLLLFLVASPKVAKASSLLSLSLTNFANVNDPLLGKKHKNCNSIYGTLIGLHHPLDGVTNPEYKLLCFIQLTNFLQREEGTSFLQG